MGELLPAKNSCNGYLFTAFSIGKLQRSGGTWAPGYATAARNSLIEKNKIELNRS